MQTFIKPTEVQLLNGGYLSDKEGNPVTNQQFVEAQLQAEYIITFANLAKGKDFKGKTPYTLDQLKKDVNSSLAKKDVEYLSSPSPVKRKLTEQLRDEALSFINFQEESNNVQKVNSFMQKFNVLNDFESFGLFFEQGIVKLNKIYSVKEITEAVQECINLLD